jgi:small-conductance mechanosensitive channel
MNHKTIKKIMSIIVPLLIIAIIFCVMLFANKNTEIELQPNEYSTDSCRFNMNEDKMALCDYFDEIVPDDKVIYFSFEQTPLCNQKTQVKHNGETFNIYVATKINKQFDMNVLLECIVLLPEILSVIAWIVSNIMIYLIKQKGIKTSATITHVEAETYFDKRTLSEQVRYTYKYTYRDSEYILHEKEIKTRTDPGYKINEQINITYLKQWPAFVVEPIHMSILKIVNVGSLIFAVITIICFSNTIFNIIENF